MINLKKQVWRTGALCLAGVVALSVTGVSVYAKTSEKKETEVKEQIRDAVDDIWKSEDTSAASIDETVYVILNADGTQQKIYISDWLKNQGEKDSYTQSTSDSEAPVSVKITYTLDGSEITPAELNGKSGHVVIRYDYTNELYETREIAGKEEKIYVPFAVMTGMILDNDNFSNIKVSSGKVINDGSHSVVTGIVFPGLGTNLDMEEDFDSYLEIEADATDFTMNESYCIATNSVFSRLDFSNVDDLDDLTEAMDDLEDATNKLLDGTSDLYDGVTELYDKSGDLQDGVKELSDGSNDLRDGAYELADGAVTLRGGVGSLRSGIGTLQEGTKTLQSGAAELSKGLTQLAANNDKLNGGAGEVFDTLLTVVSSDSRIQSLIKQNLMAPLTRDNYASEMTGAIQKLTYLSTNETAARALVLAQKNLTEDQYQQMKAAAGLSAAASQPVEVNNVPAEDTSVSVETVATVSDGDAAAVVTVEAETAPVEESTPLEESTPVVQATYAETVNAIDSATKELMKTFADAIPDLTNTKTSLDNYNTFYQGLLTYTAGVASANAGATKLAAGTTQVAEGADKLVSGSKELYEGADTLVDGARELASGSGKLADGVNELSDGSDKLIDGVGELKDGAKELKDGMIEYNDEGISKLTELDTDELQEVIDRLKATSSVSENYNSFTGDNDGMDSSVKFIYKINAVK